MHCSVTGVASANGMRVEDLAEAVVAFEIDVQREYWEKREAALEALSEIDGEVSKVARRFMVSERVVRHWLQGQNVGGAPFA